MGVLFRVIYSNCTFFLCKENKNTRKICENRGFLSKHINLQATCDTSIDCAATTGLRQLFVATCGRQTQCVRDTRHTALSYPHTPHTPHSQATSPRRYCSFLLEARGTASCLPSVRPDSRTPSPPGSRKQICEEKAVLGPVSHRIRDATLKLSYYV